MAISAIGNGSYSGIIKANSRGGSAGNTSGQNMTISGNMRRGMTMSGNMSGQGMMMPGMMNGFPALTIYRIPVVPPLVIR